MAGSGSPGPLRWLNPYDGTVMPRGLIAPLLDVGRGQRRLGLPARAIELLRIQRVPEADRAQSTPIPAVDLGPSVQRDAGSERSFHGGAHCVEQRCRDGSRHGEAHHRAGDVEGLDLHHNTYAPTLVAGLGSNGAVLRITPGKAAELFIGQSGCTGCHSVSANGTRLTALAFTSGGATYAVTAAGATNPPPLSATAPDTSFTALSPDGSIYVTNAHQGFPAVGPRTGPTNLGTANAGVFETATGAAVPNSGVPTGAMTPAFSPDGSLLAFTDYAIDSGRGLALMSFDQGTRTASGYKQIYHAAAPNYAAWPFVLPDNKGVVFALGSMSDFSGGGAGLGTATPPASAPTSDLYVLDLASGQATLLAHAMGFASERDAASNNTTLPVRRCRRDAPQLRPHVIARGPGGGYFWVFFDSYRHYGNLGLQRQLWGTVAVDILGRHLAPTSPDPSHPPFYLMRVKSSAPATTPSLHRARSLSPRWRHTCTTGIDCCRRILHERRVQPPRTAPAPALRPSASKPTTAAPTQPPAATPKTAA